MLVPIGKDTGPLHKPATSLSRQISQERVLHVGVVFSSYQLPGFHTVVSGLFDYLSTLSPPAILEGFLGGYEGLVKDKAVRITKEMVDQYRNLGGQDMLCQFGDPASLAFKDNLQAVTATVKRRQLDGLILIGNFSAQVDSAFITEACAAEHLSTRVIGVPVSLDCDFPFVQQSVGYDTVCRTLTAYIGNAGSLAQNTERMWIFIRVMGDAGSHVAVHCTMQTHLNMVLLCGSELLGQCLANIVRCLCDLIVARHEQGQDYGVIMLPVGFVTDITDMRLLFTEVMKVMQTGHYETSWESIPNIAAKLKPSTAALFDVIPRDVQYEICFGGRERHANKIDLTSVSSDRLLLRLVEIELDRRRKLGMVIEDFFRGTCYPMIYQARSSLPTNFDCDLAYTMGWGAAQLVALGKSGQLVHVSGLQGSVDQWTVEGIAFTSLLRAQPDEETEELRISQARLQLLKQRGVVRPFSRLPNPEDRCTFYHGPVQYSGAAALDPTLRTTWFMENVSLQDPTELLQEISNLCCELQSTMALAKAESTIYAVNSLLSNAVSVLDSYKHLVESSETGKQTLADIPIEHMPQAWRTKRTERRATLG